MEEETSSVKTIMSYNLVRFNAYRRVAAEFVHGEVYDMHVALEAIRHKFQNQLPADVFHETEPYFLPESLLKSPPRPDRFSDPRRPAGTSSSPFSKRSSKSSSS